MGCVLWWGLGLSCAVGVCYVVSSGLGLYFFVDLVVLWVSGGFGFAFLWIGLLFLVVGGVASAA